jgi:hypothetical protein
MWWLGLIGMVVVLLVWARFEWRINDRNLHASELLERQRRARTEWEK